MGDELLKADLRALLDVLVDEPDQRMQLLKTLVFVDGISDKSFGPRVTRAVVEEFEIIEHFLNVLGIVSLRSIERLLVIQIQLVDFLRFVVRLVYLGQQLLKVLIDIDVVLYFRLLHRRNKHYQSNCFHFYFWCERFRFRNGRLGGVSRGIRTNRNAKVER